MSSRSGIRVPGQLKNLYEKVVETEAKEGKSIMKRIRVDCGICKLQKHYSIHRGITKVSSVIACEICRHFYQKLKRNPEKLQCIESVKGSCFEQKKFMDNRCRACHCIQLIENCPHTEAVYEYLSSLLSAECKKYLKGRPLDLSQMTPESLGDMGFEIEKDGKYVPVSDEEHYDIKDAEECMDSDDLSVDDSSKEEELRDESKQIEKKVEREKSQSSITPPTGASDADEVSSSSPSNEEVESEEVESNSTALQISNVVTGSFDCEDESIVDDPALIEEKSQPKQTGDPVKAKKGRRTRRKVQKVDYSTKPVIGGKRLKGPLYDQNGRLTKTGRDFCDCLNTDCPGCHFPCPKCRSPKCGSECRVNRRWYYEKIEIEGTKVVITNKYVKF